MTDNTLPRPDFTDERRSIQRWHCADGAVVVDLRGQETGVFFHTNQTEDQPRRSLADPRQLIAALTAATAAHDNFRSGSEPDA